MPTHPGGALMFRPNEPRANRQRPAESREDNGAVASCLPSQFPLSRTFHGQGPRGRGQGPFEIWPLVGLALAGLLAGQRRRS